MPTQYIQANERSHQRGQPIRSPNKPQPRAASSNSLQEPTEWLLSPPPRSGFGSTSPVKSYITPATQGASGRSISLDIPALATPHRCSRLLRPSVPEALSLERSSSAETIKAPTTGGGGVGGGGSSRRGRSPPLTPFPPWMSESDAGCRESDGIGSSTLRGDRHERQDNEGSRLVQKVMHATVLGVQCLVLMVVFGVVVGMTVWERTESTAQFWTWCWTYTMPLLTATLITAFATLLGLEACGLSDVALLYIQSIILLLSTATSMTLWLQCLDPKSSRVAKGWLMGCSALVWGVMLMSYIRAATVWMAEKRRQNRKLVTSREVYGTFR